MSPRLRANRPSCRLETRSTAHVGRRRRCRAADRGVAQLARAHRADAVNHRRAPQRVVVEQPLELARVLVSHGSTCRRAGSTAVLGPLARVVPRRRAQWLRVARLPVVEVRHEAEDGLAQLQARVGWDLGRDVAPVRKAPAQQHRRQARLVTRLLLRYAPSLMQEYSVCSNRERREAWRAPRVSPEFPTSAEGADNWRSSYVDARLSPLLIT